MGSGLPNTAEILEVVGNGIKSAVKDGSNGAGLGRDVTVSGAVGALVRQKNMCGDRRYVQCLGGVPILGDVTDNGDDGEMRGRQRLGVYLGGGGNGDPGSSLHQGVHKEATGNRSGKGGLLPHL